MNFETLCLHAGQEPDPSTLSRGVPVHRTTAYLFKDTEHAANLFALKELGNIYTRIMNPTQDVLEQRMAALDGGMASLALSSGTSAIFYAVINLCKAGDEIVSANNLYGGTYTQFNDILPQFNINTKFVDPKDPENFAKAITPKTKLIFCETIGNPALDIVDIEAIAEVAHAHGLPLVVDSTFTTPYLQRPIEHGADIVVHSLTKWLGGHGAGIGGIVVDSGKFNWQSDKFPLMVDPEPSYHGVRWAHDLGELNPLAYILRMRVVPLRNLGACISPDNAWMFLQGIETLPLRMDRHCENALTVAKHLQAHSAVEWVRFPGLEGDPSYALNQKYTDGKGGAMVIFGIKGGGEAGSKFIDSLGLFSHLANVGDAKSLAIHPATTTHSQLGEEEQRAGGITPELVRLSIGLETASDLIEDIDQALAAATA
ncbi:MAG: O-acetylhomoserine aminocarboxypropyltransferase/cysteine synthase [Gemmatimonadetes bacterium]|jgi:O-acetylhomoserine (thiol)-lyase|nr:O-acetylhomoserine aminocarboxypropyltransferase/cysteine synthase [Gemmatimonadota bacterium]MDE0962512.1 O-acetylhomoserine aminocarboxypropyltransferase/cysteine synthase [Candidatus Latescibacterota bacterium]MBT5328229.1 O-acetylhomoserine aminocarboxypropyltransferase/cysteine synthase [Gemmatimonadota bacterium]MBT5804000.1 O-acetylhomoserine aminocarboxypropyltransferase/cysteine synthase [Gemmatimonadota bacterium]MBT6620918.1 O-acetylhomoserine aminocarboxypropyltransferase/cystein